MRVGLSLYKIHEVIKNIEIDKWRKERASWETNSYRDVETIIQRVDERLQEVQIMMNVIERNRREQSNLLCVENKSCTMMKLDTIVEFKMQITKI